MKNKRSFYIALILLLGVALTIGYAVLSQTLKIKGNTSIASNSWIIYFDHLMERPGTLEATVPAKINAAKDRIDFTITLDKPGDNYTFETDIINDGTIDAMIDSVSLSGLPSSLNNIVEWKVTYLDGTSLQKCDELLSKTKRRIKVVVDYKKDIDALPEETDMELSLEVHYIQLDNTECSTTNPSTPDPIDPDDGRYTLTVDPNYGIYNGTDAPTIVRMVPGEVYVFGADPIHDQHTFTGWTVDSSETYNETAGIITMDEEDINAIAGWTEIVDPENLIPNCFRVNNNYFTTFNSALNSIAEEGTIYLISNSCTISETDIIPEGKTITFDLNGHEITHTKHFNNQGIFTITDTSKRNSGKLTATTGVESAPLIYNNNTIIDTDSIKINFINARIINNRDEILVHNLGGDIYVDGGEYQTAQEFIQDSSSTSFKSDITIKNSLIKLNNTGYDHSVSAMHITGNVNKATFINNKVEAIVTGASIEVVYLNRKPEMLEVHDIDIDVNMVNSGTARAICDHSNGLTYDVEFDNINFYVHCNSASIQGIEISGDKDVTVKNSSFKYDLVSGTIYGMTYHSGGLNILENVDLDIKINSGNIYAMYGSYYDYTNGNVTIDITQGAGTIYGLYCTYECNINNVNVDINQQGSGGTIYGAYFDGQLNYNRGTISVVTHNLGTVYGLANFHSDGVIDSVDISVDSHGDGYTLYGLSMQNGIYKNSKFTMKNEGHKQWFHNIYGATLENVVEIPGENG